MSNGSFPNSWREAIPTFIWLVLIAAFGFLLAESLGALFENPVWRAIFAFISIIGLLAMLIYRAWLVKQFENLSGGSLLSAILVCILVLMAAPFIQEGRWPKIPFVNLNATVMPVPLVTVHDAPSAEDIAKATAPIQKQLNEAMSERNAAVLKAKTLQQQLDEALRTRLAWVTLDEFERVKRKKDKELLPFSPDYFYEMRARSAPTDLFKDDWIKISNAYKSKDRENVRDGFFKVIVSSDKGYPRLYFRDSDWESIQKYNDEQKLTAYCQFKGFSKDKEKNDQVLAYCELP